MRGMAGLKCQSLQSRPFPRLLSVRQPVRAAIIAPQTEIRYQQIPRCAPLLDDLRSVNQGANISASHRAYAAMTTLIATTRPTLLVAGLSICLLPLASAQAQPVGGVATLEHVMVTATGASDSLSPSSTQARRQLHAAPESASIIDAATLESGTALTLADALSHAPGVFAQSGAGLHGTQISIRGSGLTSPLGVRGVALLRDGLPLGQADGSVNPAYADPFNARYIEVLRGAAGLRYGAATLGGAINLVSPTGYSHPGIEARFEAGSHGYLQAMARAGQSFGNGTDAFVSLARYGNDEQPGQPYERATRLYANFGVAWSPKSEGRFHINIDRLRQDFASAMTLAQVQGGDGADVPPDWPDGSTRTHPHVRLAYQHAWRPNENDLLLLGAWYTRSKFDVLGTAVPIYYDSTDYGLSVRGETKRYWQGRLNTFAWGVQFSQGVGDSETTGPFQLPGGHVYDPNLAQFEEIRARSRTVQLHVEDTLQLTPALALSAGVHGTLARRSRHIDALRNPPGLPWFRDVDESAHYRGLSPQAGLVWQSSPDTQVYGSISRSFEPPTTIELYNSQGTTRAQRATTYELGTRGSVGKARWEVAVFYSRIRDQLLRIALPAGTPGPGYEGGNIDRSVQTGLEASVGGQVQVAALPGHIEWNVTHTYSRFRFDDDPVFGNNAVPGIPPHYGRIDVIWRHPSGFYAGPSVRYAASWYADQENTVRAPGYGLIDFTIGYADPDGRYRVYLDGRNLSNKRYVASTAYLAAAADPTQARAYYPGAPRGVYAGAQFVW